MAVISRTRGTLRPNPVEFLTRAEVQLAHARQAQDEGDLPRAVVYAYRAGLRCAGAIIEAEKKGRRRLPAGSAWARLESVRPDLKDWVAAFEKHSRLAARADIGLERELEVAEFQAVYSDASELLEIARISLGLGLQAA